MAEALEIDLPPISEDAPCGPDLDMDGDLAFMNFTAAYEGLLPTTSFFEFERSSIEFPAAFAAAAPLRKRTQDLRLILLVARLRILNRDLYGFASEVAEASWLLVNRWDEVH